MNNSQFTIHNSPFITHNSQFINRNSQFTIHNSQSIIQNPESKIQDPRSGSKNPRSKRSPERLLDARGGFEDEVAYSELKVGSRFSSFQCLVKSDGLKTCSYGFRRCFAAIWHIPNHFLSIEVY